MQRREFLRAAGAGAGAVGAASATARGAQEEEGEEESGGGGGSETVVVGPDGELVFEPESLSVQPGTTVVFEWDSAGHNVAPTSVPEGAEWEGHPEVVDDPNTYEHTFEAEGTYEYECTPHATAGMVGEVVVDPNAGGEGGGGGGGPSVPASAMSLAIAIVAAMTSTVGLAFFFLKYGASPEDE